MKPLFDYLWFVLVVGMLLAALNHIGGCDHQGDRTLEPTGQLPVQQPLPWD